MVNAICFQSALPMKAKTGLLNQSSNKAGLFGVSHKETDGTKYRILNASLCSPSLYEYE